MQRIVLAYSGGLETSVAIPWLKDRYGAQIIAVTLDLGQGGALEEVHDRALAAGALRARVLDVKEECAREYVLPTLKANAVDDGRGRLAAALSRPLIARKLVEMAEIEQATAPTTMRPALVLPGVPADLAARKAPDVGRKKLLVTK